MTYIKELVKKLSQPVPYKWRVQGANKDKTKVQLTAYIDARQVQDLLDEHCEHGWSSAFRDVAGGVFCSIQIHGPEGELWVREDAGNRIEDNSQDQMFEQGFKAAASDAFKRAAVQFGIGRFLYDIEKVWLPCNEKRQPINERGEVIWDLTEYMNSRKAPAKKSKPAPAKPAADVKPESVSSSNATSTEATPPSPTQPPVEPKKKLDSKTYDAMIKAITNGEKDRVREAMDRYDLTLQQRTLLNTLLNK